MSKQQYVVKITSHYQNPPLVLGKYYFDTEQEAEILSPHYGQPANHLTYTRWL